MPATRHIKKNGNGKHVEHRIESLKEAIEQIESELKGAAGDAVESAKGSITDAIHMAGEKAEEIEEWAGEKAEMARNLIRAKPLASILVSMSAGALVGALLLRR